jgi:hypothetical protein
MEEGRKKLAGAFFAGVGVEKSDEGSVATTAEEEKKEIKEAKPDEESEVRISLSSDVG